MEQFKTSEINELFQLSRLGKYFYIDILQQIKILHNEFVKKDKTKSDVLEFLEELCETFGISISIIESEMKRIPKSGPYMVVSNHPFKFIDEILILLIFLKKDKNFKIIGSPELSNLFLFEDIILSNEIFENKPEKTKITVKKIKKIKDQFKDQLSLGVFPASNGIHYSYKDYNKYDRIWNPKIIKQISLNNYPVLPICITENSKLIEVILKNMNPQFFELSSDLKKNNVKNTNVHVRIGEIIKKNKLDNFITTKDLSKYIRSKIYALGNSLNIDLFYKNNVFNETDKTEPIIKPISKAIIKKEIEYCKNQSLLFNIGNYSVFCTKAIHIPNVILEIGRLREFTFRQIGEGTQKSVDLDQFDLYYNHLIIWDNENSSIVGSYRIGKGKEIMSEYGIKGFYIRSLFKIDSEISYLLEESIELGRAFIVPEYQKKTMPLFLLWKGIFNVLLQNPEYRYLIGPISISNDYSKFSKDLLVSFVQSNYYDEEIARYFKPKKQFKISKKFKEDIKFLVEENTDNIEKLDSLISELEINKRIPILLKKYLSLESKIIGFNVDPLFNNCLDGLLLLDILKVPSNVIVSLSKEFKS